MRVYGHVLSAEARGAVRSPVAAGFRRWARALCPRTRPWRSRAGGRGRPRGRRAGGEDWTVWRGERLQWRRIKFNAWFDYLTDRAGKGENDIDLESLLRMRARIHGLVRSEVARLGGDPRRVILGGASQGCCVALDAALTYPEELGGVIGIVGHVLGSTPLDPAKRTMPLHLFHEASDKEMNWKWVKDTVQRLIDGGFHVVSRREVDPTGNGHWIQDIEGPWIRSALRRLVFGGAGPR